MLPFSIIHGSSPSTLSRLQLITYRSIVSLGLSALDPDSIHIDFTPQSLPTKLDHNWISPLWSCLHYEVNEVNVHKAQLWSRDSILATRCYTVLFLDILFSWLWTLSAPHKFNNTFVSCTVWPPLDVMTFSTTCASSKSRLPPDSRAEGGCSPPYFHKERQRTTNESAAKMISRLIYRVCASTYVAILMLRFNNEGVWPKNFAHAYARFFSYI